MASVPEASPAPGAGWAKDLVLRGFKTMWWVWTFPLALILAVSFDHFFLLNYVHVLSAILWTGADLLLGFVIGPVLRRLDPPTRLKVQRELLPRTLLYFPVMSGTTGASGWYLAQQLGYLDPASPRFVWAVAALALLAFLAVQGLGVLLPTNLRVYGEMQRPAPDVERVWRLMSRYFVLVGFQGLLQVGIVFLMAHLRLG